jgi:hypothetical protein
MQAENPNQHMNDTELELRLQAIEQRLLQTETVKAGQGAADHRKMSWEIRDTAKLLALRSLVQELAVSAGVSPERADTTFQRRTLYYLDCLHQMAERKDAGLAALTDDRNLDEVPTETAFPALFDDPED